MKSVYVVGDIHGCYDALMRLEEKVNCHAASRGCEPLIVSVGDLIDRGPESLRVVQHIMRGVQSGVWAVVAGNHEACLFESLFALLPAARSVLPVPHYIIPLEQKFGRDTVRYADEWREFVAARSGSWLRQGGRVAVESFGGKPDQPESWLHCSEELHFLAQLPMVWEDSRTIVTHALAFAPDIAYARRLKSGASVWHDSSEHEERVDGLLWNRYASLPADPVKIHVSGHTPLKAVSRFEEQNRIMIDTACVYGNALTAWCEATDEVIQVDGEKHV